jgi:hypothetical protein
MHIGPYSAEAENIQKIHTAIKSQLPRTQRETPRNLPRRPQKNRTGKTQNGAAATDEVRDSSYFIRFANSAICSLNLSLIFVNRIAADG